MAIKTILIAWVLRHGYLGLYSALVLGIVGIPVPDEMLLTYAGSLAARGTLVLPGVMAAALAGSATGITLSYGLGRLAGARLDSPLGRRLGLTPERRARVQRWFDRWGRFTLIIGYFVPGLRHIAALSAGASKLPYRRIAPFMYVGALLWSQTFVLAGYVLGDHWERVEGTIHAHLIALTVTVAAILAIVIAVRTWRSRRSP